MSLTYSLYRATLAAAFVGFRTGLKQSRGLRLKVHDRVDGGAGRKEEQIKNNEINQKVKSWVSLQAVNSSVTLVHSVKFYYPQDISLYLSSSGNPKREKTFGTTAVKRRRLLGGRERWRREDHLRGEKWPPRQNKQCRRN